jgi:hypothetical protein
MAKLHEKYYKHRDLIKELLGDYEIDNAEDLSNALNSFTSKQVYTLLVYDII